MNWVACAFTEYEPGRSNEVLYRADRAKDGLTFSRPEASQFPTPAAALEGVPLVPRRDWRAVPRLD